MGKPQVIHLMHLKFPYIYIYFLQLSDSDLEAHPFHDPTWYDSTNDEQSSEIVTQPDPPVVQPTPMPVPPTTTHQVRDIPVVLPPDRPDMSAAIQSLVSRATPRYERLLESWDVVSDYAVALDLVRDMLQEMRRILGQRD